jgi:hypothetical protein
MRMAAVEKSTKHKEREKRRERLQKAHREFLEVACRRFASCASSRNNPHSISVRAQAA